MWRWLWSNGTMAPDAAVVLNVEHSDAAVTLLALLPLAPQYTKPHGRRYIDPPADALYQLSGRADSGERSMVPVLSVHTEGAAVMLQVRLVLNVAE